ncbi:MAG: fructosamine kinase family protein [Bacteroidia bacterium]
MNIPVMFTAIQNKLKECLETTLNESQNSVNVEQIHGGSINTVYSFCYGAAKFLVKINENERFPQLFEKEAAGLSLMAQASALVVPKVILYNSTEKFQFLVLEYLEERTPSEMYWERLGKGLALMHKVSNTSFGLDQDNYIGSISQLNKFRGTFSEFFVTQRLEPLISKAIDERYLERNVIRNFERLFQRLDEIIPAEKPALLHGDLWSGNIMPVSNGAAVFDPAVYYGHREADIAMTRLFRGFHDVFYESYNAEFPLEKNWEKRQSIFNLYPLLVHVHLFGGSYIGDVKTIISYY